MRTDVPAAVVYYDGGLTKEEYGALDEHCVDPRDHTVFCSAKGAVYAQHCTPNLWE